MYMGKKLIKSVTYLMLACLMLINMTSCSIATQKVKASSLMDGIKANTVTGKPADRTFISSTANFSVELFKNALEDNKNSLVAPTSVLLALSMTANGASGDTLSQMEQVLGGGICIDDLNQYLYPYAKHLASSQKAKLSIANSIWFRNDDDRLKIEQSFLQKNADYFNAAAYSSAFDDQTVKDINSWVSRNTDGMIHSILDNISENEVMYLINAVAFDSEWETIYTKSNVLSSTFTSASGEKQSCEFMVSYENTFIDDGKATGFMKDYKGGLYSFVALLPNEGVGINEYISQMTGSSFTNAINSAKNESVHVMLPKFSYEYSTKLNDSLKAMGITRAFDSDADFSRLGSSSKGDLYIGKVLHKTFISVYEKGTKAGAATSVSINAKSAPGEKRTVCLDRPFIYAIIDNSTGLPIFMGTLMSLK